MSPIYPVVSARLMVRALERAGFSIDRQSGSHLILKRPSDKRRVTVPVHAQDLHLGILKSILHQAGMSVEDLKSFL